MTTRYQTDFSQRYGEIAGYEELRGQKARKTLAILEDFCDRDTRELSALEIGCFRGAVSRALAPRFREYMALDIDRSAVALAGSHPHPDNLRFSVQNAERLALRDESIDVVLCSHVYEHMPRPEVMMREIWRVLKPGGVCYFAAGNRLTLLEPHHRLPFLSWLPKPLAHRYVRWAGKGDEYYETLRTLPRLERLVESFSVVDYTGSVLREPERFAATELVRPNTLAQRVALLAYRWLPALFPTFIWLLVKEPRPATAT